MCAEKRKVILPESALYYRSYNSKLSPLDSDNQLLPTLVRTKVNGCVCYVAENSESNRVFHSVSNILRLTQAERTKKALEQWEEKVGKAEAKRIRDQAIRAGNIVHSYFHSYITEGRTQDVGKAYEPYLEALNQLLPNFEEQFLSEQFVVSFKYRYFGRIDQFGLYRGSLTLSDLKTALKPKHSINWVQDKILQLAAYYIPIEALYPVEQAALIYLISDGSYNEFLFTPKQMETYKELWLEKVLQVNEMLSFAA